ncbi:transporter [Xanthobacter oligotrophicus]|uniref:transporter n=1 Tax=Xanthobacter oligotrophicus TaxID=2607286 RepID=UPI0011F21D0D|nr:transporter [Xanthobacter oligotrophicus]MCG5234940.1 transporter [Xanthobacter oligotrophicus]
MLPALILLAPSPAGAGAWTQEEGHGQVILQGSAVHSGSEFGPSSDLYDSRPYDKLEATLVFEYGASDWLTLIVAPQLLSVDLGAPAPSSYAGLGYTDAGARVRIYNENNIVVSAQVVGRLPGTGNSQSAAAVGYEDPELDLRLLAGWSFPLFGKAAFLDVEAAQRLRFGDPPDEFHLDLTLGVRVAERWQVLFQSFNVISEGAGEGPYFGTSYEYYKLQLGAAYDLSAAVTLGVALVSTVFARNAPQENGVVLTGFYRF